MTDDNTKKRIGDMQKRELKHRYHFRCKNILFCEDNIQVCSTSSPMEILNAERDAPPK